MPAPILTCTACDKRTAAGVHLCLDDLRRLEDLLSTIPETLQDADTSITRQNVSLAPGQQVSATNAEAPEPVNWAAADRARDLWATLNAWCYELEGDHGPGEGDHPAERLRSLSAEIRLSPDAGQLLDELSDAHSRLLRATDLPPDVVTLGGCGHVPEGEGVACPGVVRGYQVNRELPRWARCDTCGATYGAAERRREMIADSWHVKERLAVVVRALNIEGFPINLKTAQWWVQKKHLRTPWQNAHGTRLYTMAQVYDIHQEMKQQGKKKHGRRKRRQAA